MAKSIDERIEETKARLAKLEDLKKRKSMPKVKPMKKSLLLETLYGFTEQTYYKWQKESRPIVNLIKTYFSNHELEEFINTGAIKKYDLVKDLSVEDIEKLLQAEELLAKIGTQIHTFNKGK